MKAGAVVAIFFGAIAGIALTLHLTAMKTLSSFEPPSTITQREIRINDAVVFQSASHDPTRFVTFIEAVTDKKGTAPLTACQEEMVLGDKSYKSSLRKEFGAGDSQLVMSFLIFAPRTAYQKDAKFRLVCRTAVTDWQAVKLPELTFR